MDELNTNKNNSVTTDLFDVLVNLRNVKEIKHNGQTIESDLLNVPDKLPDARITEYNKQSITSDLFDIIMDIDGNEITEELVEMCEQDNKNLFDLLVELHGPEVTKELIYTYGKAKGLKFGKQLGKFKNPLSAIKQIHKYIESQYDTKKQISFENKSSNNLNGNKKTNIFNPLYIHTQGFIEGALSSMTNMEVNVNINDKNKDKIDFKPKKYFFKCF